MKFCNRHNVFGISLVILLLPLLVASGGCSATIPIGSDVGGAGGDDGAATGSGAGGGQSSTGAGAGGVAACDLSAPWQPSQPIPGLTTGVEASIWVNADETVALFIAPVIDQFDVWTATRDTPWGVFGARTQVSASTAYNDYGPRLSPDGLTLYFNRGAPAPRDVMYSTRTTLDDEFVVAEPLPVAATAGNDEGEGCPTASGLYFGRDSHDGNSYDLWYAPRVANGFGTPVPLSELNSPAEELSPTLSADERTIYFLSQRPGGFGDRDIWVAHRPDVNAPFDAPTNVTELNTSEAELPGTLSVDGCRLYVTRADSNFRYIEMASKPPL